MGKLKPVITVLNNGLESGDWWILKVDDEVFNEGHHISANAWMNLLEHLGFDVVEKRNLTNDELEKEVYG